MSALPARNIPSSVCLIGGPTAVGKTAVGCELARRWKTEIVSADSMQVYRGLSVGTGKPTPGELRGVTCHLIDFLDPDERFNAAAFAERSRSILSRLIAEGRPGLVVGGTGLYLRALREGLFDQPEIPAAIRRAVETQVEREGPEPAHARLAGADPAAANRIHPHDRVRIARALEVFEATGRPISEWRARQGAAGLPWPSPLVVLNGSRPWLYERINERVGKMFEAGLIEETRRLLEAGYGPGVHSLKALGYGFVIDHIEGRATRAEAMERMRQTHRNYAKRQLTWFRKMRDARWISVEGRTVADVADETEAWLRERLGSEKNLAPPEAGRG